MPDRLTGARAAALRLVVVVAAFAVVGALAGVVWEWLWTPPSGVVLDHELLLDGDGLRSDFSGTALYVLVAAVAGLLLSVALGVVLDRHEVVTLVGVVAGSALAAWLMLRVGVALGPPDPTPLARAAEDYTRIPDALHVSRDSPYTAFPAGAMIGLIVTFIGLSRRSKVED